MLLINANISWERDEATKLRSSSGLKLPQVFREYGLRSSALSRCKCKSFRNNENIYEWLKVQWNSSFRLKLFFSIKKTTIEEDELSSWHMTPLSQHAALHSGNTASAPFEYLRVHFLKRNNKSRTMTTLIQTPFGRVCQTSINSHLCKFLNGRSFIDLQMMSPFNDGIFLSFCGFATLFLQGCQVGKQNST